MSILTGLLAKPKLIAGGLVVTGLLIMGAHYKLVIHQRDKLEVQNTKLEQKLANKKNEIELLNTTMKVERRAAREAAADRDTMRKTLESFAKGREDDPESQAWAEQIIPEGEILRICIALPEMEGCEIVNAH